MRVKATHSLAATLATAAAMLVACTDMLPEERAESDLNKGPKVQITATDEQQNRIDNDWTPTNTADYANYLAAEGLTPQDLVPQVTPIDDGKGFQAQIVEYTVLGVNPTQNTPATRGKPIDTLEEDYGVFGARGTTPAETTGPLDWVYNAAWSKDGVPRQPYYWSRNYHYGRLYGIYPFPTADKGMVMGPKGQVGPPSINFTVSKNVRKQVDMVTASSDLMTYMGEGDAPKVKFLFKHALTAVRFAIGSNLSYNKRIVKVRLNNVYSKGTYTLGINKSNENAKWTNLQERTNFELNNVNLSLRGEVGNIFLGNNDEYTFFMIPQVVTGNISVTITFSNGEEYTSPLKGTWKRGTTKTYKITEINSDWKYELNVDGGYEVMSEDFERDKTMPFKVTSYRTDPETGMQQPVPWKIIGYEPVIENGGTIGKLNETCPQWLVIDKDNGKGGMASEPCNLTVKATKAPVEDLLAQRNLRLKEWAQCIKGSYGEFTLGWEDGDWNTANTYIISHAGRYALPLYYGNAKKNGHDNPAAYAHAVDYMGHKITQSWIPNGKLHGAKVLWSNPKGAVTIDEDKGLYNSSIHLVVHGDKVANGNAVVALLDEKNNVVWSWQLWFTDKDAVTKNVKVKGSDDNNYDFMSEPLGWRYTEWKHVKGAKQPLKVRVIIEQTVGNAVKKRASFIVGQNQMKFSGDCTIYQYGRKDPFPSHKGPYSFSLATAPAWNHLGYESFIRYPLCFFTCVSKETTPELYRSKYSRWMWDGDDDHSNNPNHQNVKTVYDPCPYGYKIPSVKAANFLYNFAIGSKGHWQATILEKYPNGVYIKANAKNDKMFMPFHFLRNQTSGHLATYWDIDTQKPEYNTFWCYEYQDHGPRMGRRYGWVHTYGLNTDSGAGLPNALGVRPVAE